MKKLAITQIVLGMLISLSTAFIIAWDLPDAFYIRVRLHDADTFQRIFNPDTKEVVAACLTILLLLLGLTVLGLGIVQLVESLGGEHSANSPSALKSKNSKLAITQTVLGMLIGISAFLVFIWGFPTSYFYQLPSGERGGVFFTPGPLFIMAQQLSALVFLLGLAVLGCGVARCVKARHKISDKVDELQTNGNGGRRVVEVSGGR